MYYYKDLFRVWDREEEKYLSDKKVLFIGNSGEVAEMNFGHVHFLCDSYSDLFEVEMFTGLSDSNKNCIYVGDILTNNYNANGVVIKGIDGYFLDTVYKDGQNLRIRLGNVSGVTEIIGNKNNNPELIEEMQNLKKKYCYERVD